MTVCAKCKTRVAKRSCPALGSSLCNLCCGLLREKEVHCPAACPFLGRHKPYQEKKVLEKKAFAPSRNPFAEDEILKDERLAWLVFQLETPFRVFAERSPSLTDKDVILALEYARGKVEKGKSLIILPGESLKPRNALGEAVYQASENTRWEAPIILASGLEAYKKDEKLRCLDRIIRSVKYLAGDNPGGRAYLTNLAERFARIKSPSSAR
jgi:hypothetical protein